MRARRARALLALLALLVAALVTVAALGMQSAPADFVWWTTHALDKVHPGERPRPPGGIELLAARNEFEPFQLVLRAGAGRVDDVDVVLTDLAGPGGARIPADQATIYVERYLLVRTPSSVEGKAGEWPDALVPAVDRYAGEKRNAFPVTLEPGRNQPVWIDLYVPPGTAPGEYRGKAVMRVEGEDRAAAPVTLEVLAFDLPSTSSLANSFGFSGISAMQAHYGGWRGDAELFELSRLYGRALLRHRISMHGGSMAPPEWTASPVTVKWLRYDQEVGPFLQGTVFGPGEPLAGARATSIDVRTPPSLPEDGSKVLYWREWARHFEQRGWLDRLFLYLWDEPFRDDHYGQVLALGEEARSASPALRTLLTEQLSSKLDPVIDVWVTLVNCIEPRSGVDPYCEETVPRKAYAAAERAGRQVWWYQSCASHGCNIVGEAPAFTRWPSYVVDVDPVANRIMPWLAYEYGIDGELYYNTVEAYNSAPTAPADGAVTAVARERDKNSAPTAPADGAVTAVARERDKNSAPTAPADGAVTAVARERDKNSAPTKSPWDDQHLHGGNGDGTLFYPGTPDRIGGRTHVPIESVRLKLIREGLEDYEYLVLLGRAAGAGAARDEAKKIARSVYDWDRSPDALYAARRAVAAQIAGGSGARPGATAEVRSRPEGSQPETSR